MIRIGSALFNADHTRLGEELKRVEASGIDFIHFDVFDGYFVKDQAFPARTIEALRPLSRLPFEIHLAVNEPERFLPALKKAGADLVFLPAESTPLLYETLFTVRELGLKTGLCLALGTSLHVLDPVLPMLDAVLLLGRVTGEGKRGRDFNQLVLDRVRAVRKLVDAGGHTADIQAAGGLETDSCVLACQAGATSLPLGASLHREPDLKAYVSFLRQRIAGELPHQASSPDGAAAAVSVTQPPAAPSAGSGRVWNVLIASRSFGKHCPEVLTALQASGCSFVTGFDKTPSEAELRSRIQDVDVLVSGTEPVTAAVIEAAPRLKIIAKHGVGFDNIDVQAARARSIPVALAGPAVVDSVADLTLALLLGIARSIPQGNAGIRAGRWDRLVGPQLMGKTLGIVGLGQIGKAVCRRATGFGLRCLAFDAKPDKDFAAAWSVEFCSLDELLGQSDFVSLHAPSTPETRGMIGQVQLARMKSTAYLVNTARGELVDENALYEALKSRTIAGAASDVFVEEPPPRDHPLLSLGNFIAMPHCAGQTPEGLRQMGEITARNILAVLNGGRPLHEVA